MAYEYSFTVSPVVLTIDTICDIINITDMVSIFFIPTTTVEGNQSI